MFFNCITNKIIKESTTKMKNGQKINVRFRFCQYTFVKRPLVKSGSHQNALNLVFLIENVLPYILYTYIGNGLGDLLCSINII